MTDAEKTNVAKIKRIIFNAEDKWLKKYDDHAEIDVDIIARKLVSKGIGDTTIIDRYLFEEMSDADRQTRLERYSMALERIVYKLSRCTACTWCPYMAACDMRQNKKNITPDRCFEKMVELSYAEIGSKT